MFHLLRTASACSTPNGINARITSSRWSRTPLVAAVVERAGAQRLTASMRGSRTWNTSLPHVTQWVLNA